MLREMLQASDNVVEDGTMDWKRRLKTDERELKALIDRLGEPSEGAMLSCDDRETAIRILGVKLAEMRSFVDDCMSGRSDHEKAVLEYKLRVEYPLFSHLTSLSALSREYVDWSCALSTAAR
jgi:hypothetical protein